MSIPNAGTETLDRIKKLERMRALGVNPFATRFAVTDQIDKLVEKYPAKIDENTPSPFRVIDDIIPNPTGDVALAGRVMLHRSFGKICFATIHDGTGKIQVLFSRENCSINIDGKLVPTIGESSQKTTFSEPLSAYKFAEKLIDLGDFIGVKGELFYTHKGELTLFVKEFTFLTKALRPLPEKWHGLSDKEDLYRERNLDLLSNDETLARFKLRSKVVREMRHFFESKGFDEVETSILQAQAGGAMARTFSTHHNDLDHDFVLRIALEIDLKRTIGGGFTRIFEIGKNFRNEGTDPSHLQEFTMCEWYAAYLDLDTNKKWTEELFHHIAETCLPSPIVQVMNKNGELIDVDLGAKFAERRFPDLLREYAGVDMFHDSMEKLQEVAKNVGVEKVAGVGRANLLDDIYKKTARTKLVQPTFVFDYPEDLKPLARPNGDGTACCFQLVINGWEVVNSYGELIDPLVQRKLFEVQASAKAGGDEEAMDVDEVFLKAMEHGFPPMTGSGFGIDRLVTLFTGQGNLRDVVLFPTMRPTGEKKSERQETKIATIVINKASNLEKWQIMNAIGHLSSAFGARTGKDLFYADTITSRDGEKIFLNIQHAIMIKEGTSDKELKELIKTAKNQNIHIAEFTRDMLKTTNDKAIIEEAKNTNYQEIEHLGVLVFGGKKEVDDLTGGFSLMQ